MKYYSTQRPVMPGSYPKPHGNQIREICNFDQRTYCNEISREAWGYIEYAKPLAPSAVSNYELTAAQ